MNALPIIHTADLSGWNIVGSGGGAPASQTFAGAWLACEFAGIELHLIGGASGGAITAALAAVMSAAKLVPAMIDFDAASLFEKNITITELIKRGSTDNGVARRRYSVRKGVMSTMGLGALIDEQVPTWPQKLWIVAVSATHLYLFTAEGVRRIANGKAEWVQKEAAPVGLAVRASCAFPGVFESVEFAGEQLWDGCLSDYGDCPTRLVQDHFGCTASKTIALDLNGGLSTPRRILFGAARLLSGRSSQYWPGISRTDELFITPASEDLGRAVQFKLTRTQKETAVLSGFRAAVKKLAAANLLIGEKLEICTKASESYLEMHRLLIATEQAA